MSAKKKNEEIPMSGSKGEEENATLPTRMDLYTAKQWKIREKRIRDYSDLRSEQIKNMLLFCENIWDGSGVDQLQHNLQCATLAVKDGAEKEVVVAALLHDVGKIFDMFNHAAVIAEILRTKVSHEVYEMLRYHTLFQCRFFGHLNSNELVVEHNSLSYLVRDPTAHRQLENESWFPLAMKFTADWDQQAFDPKAETLPISYFDPILKEVFNNKVFSVVKKSTGSGV